MQTSNTEKAVFRFGTGVRLEAPEPLNEPVRRAMDRFYRDCRMALTERGEARSIRLEYAKEGLAPEQYSWDFPEADTMRILAADDLGLIYALIEISKRFMDVQPFWFWMDRAPKRRPLAQLPMEPYRREPFRVRYRGWFINDEVLLMKWRPNGSSTYGWEMAMEALLRCGGNLVIPGTDKDSRLYRPLASAMGLWITHHHAEPLGAEMFARAYPELSPSYKAYPELFRKLWEDSIEAQKDGKVIWTLGFRGQGDHPFWEHDPEYATDRSRGELISRIIRLQYDLVHVKVPNAVCCTNLYGEIMDLYRKGCITLPEDVIRIWADNGFGAMVSRRQENSNPRVDALPGQQEQRGHHGLYYHMSFYDLQAANHMTMLPNPTDFVARTLSLCYERGIRDFWIINSSNVRPHVFNLELIRRLWSRELTDFDRKAYARDFAKIYLEADEQNAEAIGGCYDAFASNSIVYGPNEDDRAGEQFTNYVPRILNWAFRRGDFGCVKELLWATGDKPFWEQVQWFYERLLERESSYKAYLASCGEVEEHLTDPCRKRFHDGIHLQVKMYAAALEGSLFFCRSLFACRDLQYLKGFYLAGRAMEAFQKAQEAMEGCEDGIWSGFYANECLSDFKYTAYDMLQLMGHIRNLGDGPHGFLWMKEVSYSEGDRRLSLISHMDNHPTNEALYRMMKENKKYESWGVNLCKRKSNV